MLWGYITADHSTLSSMLLVIFVTKQQQCSRMSITIVDILVKMSVSLIQNSNNIPYD